MISLRTFSTIIMNFKGLFKTMDIEKPEYCTGSGIIIYLDNRESIFTDLKNDILYLFLGLGCKLIKFNLLM